MWRKKIQPTILMTVILVFSGAIIGGAVGFLLAQIWFEPSMIKLLSTNREFNGFSGQTTSTEMIFLADGETTSLEAVVAKALPAVVSIVQTKDVPVYEQYYAPPLVDPFFQEFFGDQFDEFFGVPHLRQRGTERQEISQGTGFIITTDGYILTNKHVVFDEAAQYTVILNDNQTKYEAEVLARDPANDLAVLKIKADNLPYLKLGDSAKLKLGQRVITIGNALGEFSNTVSSGIISGLSRSIVAAGAGFTEQLVGLIQTDAAINPGNSGGPMLNLAGEVVGINTAIAINAQNIGFAIAINDVKSAVESVQREGRIIRPWLGVRYMMVNSALAQENNLARDYGALIVAGGRPEETAIVSGSPAEKAGLEEGDIILEVDGQRLDQQFPLAQAIIKKRVNEEITLKIFRLDEEKLIKVKLGERPN